MNRFTCGVTADEKVYIQDEDFTHDARLYLNGDFQDRAQELEYIKTVIEKLNATYTTATTTTEATNTTTI